MRNTEIQNRNQSSRSRQSKGKVTQELVKRYFNNITQDKAKSQIFDEDCRRVKTQVPDGGLERFSLSGEGPMLGPEMLQTFFIEIEMKQRYGLGNS